LNVIRSTNWIRKLLLISLAVVMLVQMILIVINGLVQFVENNKVILTIEICLTALIIFFGVFVLILKTRTPFLIKISNYYVSLISGTLDKIEEIFQDSTRKYR